MQNGSVSRRDFLAGSLASTVWLAGADVIRAHERPQRRPRVAALFTELRFRSHPYNILENFFKPYLFNGELVDPGVEIASFYADQFPDSDMARDVSKQFKVPLFDSIEKAMCVGGSELAVDAVLLVGEHGEYPENEIGQHLYPRKQFFDQAVAVMRRAGCYVPLFNDKHLSYRWDWAKEMYDTARQNGMPLMAGSSVPLGQRLPPLELPAGAEIESALAVHGGGIEVYGFHGLEVLQSMVEARRGGETGIARVELLKGAALQRAADEGRWSRALFRAAIAAEKSMNVRRQPRPPLPVKNTIDTGPDDPYQIDHGILVTYRDGLRAAVIKSGGNSSRWNFACRLRGESQPRATAIYNGPWGNRCLFKALSHAIQYLFTERKEPYPIERTLLTTGALEAAMKSHAANGKPIETPHLAIGYQATDFRRFRESGASWKLLTADVLQPKAFEPGDGWIVQGKH